MLSAASVYFTVVTRDSRAAVEAYLYDHSEILREVSTSPSGSDGGRTHFLVRTEAQGHDHASLVDRARYLGRYQAERLASGLHGASQVYDLESDAVTQHRERTGVDLSA